MAEYIGCRKCDSPDCKGCNLKNLETMLRNGKFDCMMNGNRCINTAADVAPVVHGRLMATLSTTGIITAPTAAREWTVMQMQIKPITLRAASEFVNLYHRHHKATVGCKFCIGLFDGGKMVGCAANR